MSDAEPDGVVLPAEPHVEVRPAADVDAFALFFRANHARVVALLHALSGRARAEDIAQEAFARAYREWAQISRYDRPDAWVRRVAVNLATSAGRRERTETRLIEHLRLRRDVDGPAADAGHDDDELWSHVRALPPRQAAAIALRYIDDLSIGEIAVTLDCAEGTAKAHLHQARQTLARRLGERLDDEETP